jgi:hypothetical protein
MEPVIIVTFLGTGDIAPDGNLHYFLVFYFELAHGSPPVYFAQAHVIPIFSQAYYAALFMASYIFGALGLPRVAGVRDGVCKAERRHDIGAARFSDTGRGRRGGA